MASQGRGPWPLLTALFFVTTLVFAYTTFRGGSRTGEDPILVSDAPAVAAPEAAPPVPVRPPQVPPPQPRTFSAWETENAPAPLANVPVFDLTAGASGGAVVMLKTTTSWYLLLYQIPDDVTVQKGELLLKDAAERVVWGAGPLPAMEPGTRQSLVLPGEFLQRGAYRLQIKGADGAVLTFRFQLDRKRHPMEEIEAGDGVSG